MAFLVPWCSFYGGIVMNTLVIVLSAVLGQVDEQVPPQWRQTYTQAQNMAASIQRPVVVFLLPGQGSMDKLVSGGLSEQAKEVLASDYIPVMVDTSSPEGQRLARAFDIQGGQGLIISDRSGAYQAFWAQGTLSNDELVRNLQRFATQTNVRMTEVAGRSSQYPAGQPAPAGVDGSQGSPTYAPPSNSRPRFRIFQGRTRRMAS
jgi:hypothetical protein